MSFFNINPWTASTGGGDSNPIDPDSLPKVYEYSDVGTEVNQQYWKVLHPNFKPGVDKALLYLNGNALREADWSIVEREDGLYAYVPIAQVDEATIPPFLNVIVITNSFGS